MIWLDFRGPHAINLHINEEKLILLEPLQLFLALRYKKHTVLMRENKHVNKKETAN